MCSGCNQHAVQVSDCGSWHMHPTQHINTSWSWHAVSFACLFSFSQVCGHEKTEAGQSVGLSVICQQSVGVCLTLLAWSPRYFCECMFKKLFLFSFFGGSLFFCLSGRSETEVEYSVGIDGQGVISALECKAWCLAGAFMDLAWNDLYGIMTGLNQVPRTKGLPLGYDALG